MVALLARELDFNQTQAGLLTTGIFLSHAALQVPGGRLTDFGPPAGFGTGTCFLGGARYISEAVTGARRADALAGRQAGRLDRKLSFQLHRAGRLYVSNLYRGIFS